jgi:uncharacterized membrane protein YkvA (DUF1232 family)
MMRDWLIGVGATIMVVLASWGLLILLARRLPPGIMRDLAAFIPQCATTIRRLRKDPRVPRRAKIAVLIAGVWVASPIDLIPEFLPIIGPLDDIVVVALALRYAGRQVPRDVILAAWPGEPRLLERLLGPAKAPTPQVDPFATTDGLPGHRERTRRWTIRD